jgi:hypothetical protein
LRSASAALRLRRNNASLSTATTASTGVPVNSFYIGAANGNTNRSNKQIAAAFIGANLTDTQSDALYNRLHTFLVAKGATV